MRRGGLNVPMNDKHNTRRVRVGKKDLHPALSGEDDGDGFGDGIWFCRQLVIGRTPVHEKPLIRSRRCQIKTSSGQLKDRRQWTDHSPKGTVSVNGRTSPEGVQKRKVIGKDEIIDTCL